MFNKKIKLMNISKWKTEKTEARLNELAKQGWKLKHAGVIISDFEKIEPQDLKYSIELSVKKPSKEKKQYIEDSDWEYICKSNMMNFYCTDKKDAVPIHTDPIEYSYLVKKIKNILLVLFSAIIVMLALLNICMYSIVSVYKYYLYDMVRIIYLGTDDYNGETIWIQTGLALVIIFLCLMYYIVEFFRACKVIKKLDISEKTEKSLSRQNFIIRFLCIVVSAALLIQVLLINVYIDNLFNESTEIEIDNIPGNALTMDDFLEEGTYIKIENTADFNRYIDTKEKRNENGKDYWFQRFHKKDSIVTNDILSVFQRAAYYPDGIKDGSEKGQSVVIFSDYYDMKTNWLAEEMYDEMKSYWDDNEEPNEHYVEIQGSNFDEGCYSIHGTGESISLILRKGTSVQIVFLYRDTPFFIEEVISKAESAYAD